jgi:hypothetical protein
MEANMNEFETIPVDLSGIRLKGREVRRLAAIEELRAESTEEAIEATRHLVEDDPLLVTLVLGSLGIAMRADLEARGLLAGER